MHEYQISRVWNSVYTSSSGISSTMNFFHHRNYKPRDRKKSLTQVTSRPHNVVFWRSGPVEDKLIARAEHTKIPYSDFFESIIFYLHGISKAGMLTGGQNLGI